MGGALKYILNTNLIVRDSRQRGKTHPRWVVPAMPPGRILVQYTPLPRQPRREAPRRRAERGSGISPREGDDLSTRACFPGKGTQWHRCPGLLLLLIYLFSHSNSILENFEILQKRTKNIRNQANRARNRTRRGQDIMKKVLGALRNWNFAPGTSKGALLGCCGHLARTYSTYGICNLCCKGISAW